MTSPVEAPRLRGGRQDLAPVAELALDRRPSTTSARPRAACATPTWMREVVAGSAAHGERAAPTRRAPDHTGRMRGAERRSRPTSPRVAAPSSSSVSAGSAIVRRSSRELAEGEGFEPSRSFNSPYSLSRRAPSATRSSLRAGSWYRGLGAGDVVGRGAPASSPSLRGCGSRNPVGFSSHGARLRDQSNVSRTSVPPSARLELVEPEIVRRVPPADAPVLLELHDRVRDADTGCRCRIDIPNFAPIDEARRRAAAARLHRAGAVDLRVLRGVGQHVEDLLGRGLDHPLGRDRFVCVRLRSRSPRVL